VPTFDEVCAMIKVEEKTLLRRNRAANGAVAAYQAVHAARERRCGGCGRTGHTEDQC
jgi:uncharacterized protein YktA (UPF0223 family)